MARTGKWKIKAGKPLDKNRTYPKELVARIKHRYLTHRVLGYHPRAYIIGVLAREFAVDAGKIHALLQYEGIL